MTGATTLGCSCYDADESRIRSAEVELGCISFINVYCIYKSV